MNEKWYCRNCGEICTEYLTSPHPFDSKDSVTGCPKCHSVDSLEAACHADGCNKPGTSGMPTPWGYKLSCFDHSRELEAKIAAIPQENGMDTVEEK